MKQFLIKKKKGRTVVTELDSTGKHYEYIFGGMFHYIKARWWLHRYSAPWERV